MENQGKYYKIITPPEDGWNPPRIMHKDCGKHKERSFEEIINLWEDMILPQYQKYIIEKQSFEEVFPYGKWKNCPKCINEPNSTYCECYLEAKFQSEVVKNIEKSGLSLNFFSRYSIRDWLSNIKFINILRKNIEKEYYWNDPEFKKTKPWLFIAGTTGMGKTYLAVIGIILALCRERTIIFDSLSRILVKLRDQESNIYSVLRQLRQIDVLVLDDIGSEKASPWVSEKVLDIIDYRSQNRKNTIFTSNFKMEDVADNISPEVYDRIRGESVYIVLEGKSLR